MASFHLVPGVLTPPRELDLTVGAKPFSVSLGGAILVSKQGPEEDRFVTRVEVFDELYGLPNPSWSFGHYCIRKFLRKGEGCWIRRISRGARHAGSVIFNDRDGAQGTQTYFHKFAFGRYANYANGSQQLLNFKFNGPLTAGTVTFTFTNSANEDGFEVTVTQEFTASNDATLQALVDAIQTTMNQNFALPGKNVGQAFVNKVGATTNNDRVFTIIAPESVTLTVTDISVSGANPPIATMFEDATLMEVYAQNRGKWGNDIGYRLVNAANGINQRLQLNFSAPLVAGQNIQLRYVFKDSVTSAVFDRTLTPVPFATDHRTTALALIGALKTALGVQADAFLTDDSGLQITVVSPSDGANTLAFPYIEVTNNTGNAAIPTVSVLEIMQGVDSDQTFDIEVFSRDNINVPLETRTVSFVKQVSGLGDQLYLEDVINNNSTTRSSYIRIKYNTENASGILNIPPEGTAIQWLDGGDDGVLPTTGDIVNAWDFFKSRQKRPMRILINCGHTAVAVQQKMTNLARARFDCIAILDYPSDKQEAQAAFENRMTNLNVDSSYSALYSPDILELDEFSNNEIYVPPSGHVAAQYAETDAVAAEWFAPAGLNRAVLDTAIGLRELYDEDQMGLLISAQINPIINRGGTIVIWDQLTTQRKPSAFRNVSLRRMLITIEVGIVDGLDYTIHEPNDDYTALLIIQVCVSILQPIKEGRGLYAYAAISDDRNNKDYDYNMQQRNVDVIMDPILPIRTIRLTSVVTKKGAAFNEIVQTVNGGSSNLGA